MAVYVDPLWVCLRSRRWPFGEACHLTADTLEELHAFAERLGLWPNWFQNKPDLPHYDLTRGKRFQALRLGAREISHVDLGRRMEAARALRIGAGATAQEGGARG